MLNRHTHNLLHQQVCHRETCQITGPDQDQSSRQTMLLWGSYIISWMRLHGFGLHLKTECSLAHSRALGSTVYCIAFGKNPMFQTTWTWMCAKMDLCSLVGGDLSTKSVNWGRKVTFTRRASHNTVMLNIKGTTHAQHIVSRVRQGIF